MARVPARNKELRFQNIEIHSQGKTEQGTLHLLRHHACFTYVPGSNHEPHANANANAGHDAAAAPRTDCREPHASALPTGNANTEPGAPLVLAPTDAQPPTSAVPAPPHEGAPPPQPKDIWIPYALISHCVLRASYAVMLPARSTPEDGPSGGSSSDDGEDLFPPTFGTAGADRSPSTESTRPGSLASPRPSSPVHELGGPSVVHSARQPVIRIRRKDFQMMALHFHAAPGGDAATPEDAARQVFHMLRSRACIERIEDAHAFHFRPPREEVVHGFEYDARREYARMGIGEKAADGPGAAWRLSYINHDYGYSSTYPHVLCVPRAVSDNLLKYGGAFRSRARIPCLAYLHSNGGSITRSSQPLVGMQNRRNPQDERLVSAIFASHAPPLPPSSETPDSQSPTTLQSEPAALQKGVAGLPSSHSDTALDAPPPKKVYGSTRRTLIVDARPKINVIANRATGGGIEDAAHYGGAGGGVAVEKVFLNIANIHVMRASLDKVVDSFAHGDYLAVRPSAEALRRSGWLGHIAGLLDGAETVGRAVGLGGGHVLVHCSDGWDRTAQVAALAQVMLDPHYRTLAGFIALVHKEFVSFGHKFRDRHGIEGGERRFEVENERVAPARSREGNASDPGGGLNALGVKAFSGAKIWFEKNRSSLFRQPDAVSEPAGEARASSRPSSPPLTTTSSSPASATKEDKPPPASEKEVSPIFHQFLDAVYQLTHQFPTAFEFNERFLKRLFFHSYACQYGEFLFNTERERARTKLPSVWGHFLSRRHEFTNAAYRGAADDPLLFPRRQGPEQEVVVRWWAGLFGRKDGEMNVPRSRAPADPFVSVEREPVDHEASAEGEKTATDATSRPAIRESRSTPNLKDGDGDDGAHGVSGTATRIDGPSHDQAAALLSAPGSTALPDRTCVPREGGGSASPTTAAMGDGRGVSSSDFAAFASQTAFRE